MEDVEEFLAEPETNDGDDDDGKERKIRPTIRSALDLQRLKVEKLMKNPNKQILIPESSRDKNFLQSVPSFVRNVMGSSAGAGSGEFHVYRHLRRKEYARQKMIQSKSLREQLDDEYRDKIERNKSIADSKTAKKRAKRQKRKQKMKELGKKPKLQNQSEIPTDFNDPTSSDDSGCDNEPSNTELNDTSTNKESENLQKNSTSGSDCIEEAKTDDKQSICAVEVGSALLDAVSCADENPNPKVLESPGDERTEAENHSEEV